MAEENQGITFESGKIPTYEEFKGRYQPDFKSYLGREQKEDFAKQQYDTFVTQAQETGDPEKVYQQSIEGIRDSEEYQMYADQGLIDAETGQYVTQEQRQEKRDEQLRKLFNERINQQRFINAAKVSPEDLNEIVQYAPEGFDNNQVFQQLHKTFVYVLGRPIGKEGARYWSGELRRLMENEGKTFDEASTIIGQFISNSAEAKAYKETGIPASVDSSNQIPGVNYTGGTEVTQITPGQPRGPSELNVADYVGRQAISPSLSEQEQLAGQVKEIEAEEEGRIQEDIAGVTDVTAEQMSEVETIKAQTVGATTPKEAVVGTAQTTEVVDKPELATMTAEKAYEKVSAEADALQAARLELSEVDPLATVQGQLAILNEQFADGEVPIWAQGALKTANGLMAQRGLGNSSIAAEAITNALMQSTIPIAQQDASFYQVVTTTNLANEQQVAVEKFNARVNALFNDQAAENAARNLNTQSENQLNQFFSELSQNVALANTSQVNAMEQFNATARNQMTQFYDELDLSVETFNAEQLNDASRFNAEQARLVSQFNAEIRQQTEQFNALNQLSIDQSNVQWRRDVSTANTATINAATQFDVTRLFDLKMSSLNNIWQQYDTMLNFSLEMEATKQGQAFQLMLTQMQNELAEKMQEDSDLMNLIGTGVEGAVRLFASDSGTDWIKKGWDFVTG